VKRTRILAGAGAAVTAAAALAACSSAGTARPAAATGTPAAAVAPPAATAPAAVAAVPGTSNNKYVAGPFTVTLKGIEPLPAADDLTSTAGNPVPESCAEVTVKNTSNSFTGWAAPHVEFVRGHSIKGQVLETDPAGPPVGSGMNSTDSDTLAPGQSQVLYSCPQNIPAGTYVEAQLTEVDYGAPNVGTASGARIQLKY
jgi:hypothetical protein